MRRLLAHRSLPLCLALLAVLLCVNSLSLGLQTDDYVFWVMLSDPSPHPEWTRPPTRLFSFFEADANLLRARDTGGVPWWTDPELRIAFFRPLTSLLHWLDFSAWRSQPWLMHAHSLLWFGAAIAAAAVFYRRLLRPEWLAGLAALAFAVDDAHGSPAVWIANRNASVGAVFAILALIAHDRWRRDGWRPGAVLAPVALLAGLLGGEIALAAGAYLLAYAVFLDRAPWTARLMSLLPAGAVGLGWMLAYRALDFGASGSAVYIDPLASPSAFVQAVVQRGPLLLSGQWALPAQLSLVLSEAARQRLWLMACGLIVVLALLFLPLVRRDRVARFFALGMLLSLLPATSTFPHDRLLFLVGLGGAGLLGQWLGGLLDGADWRPQARLPRVLLAAGGVLLAAVHLLLAPVGLWGAAANLRMFGGVIARAGASLPGGRGAQEKTAVVVQTPSAFISVYGPVIQSLLGRPAPRRLLTLGSSIHALTVTRPDTHSLSVRPAGGYLLPPGAALPGQPQKPFDPGYLMTLFDGLYRASKPFTQGERIELTGVTIEISAVTADGRPAEVRFRFQNGLDDPSLVWLRWENGVYVPFALPAVGAQVELPPATVSFR